MVAQAFNASTRETGGSDRRISVSSGHLGLQSNSDSARASWLRPCLRKEGKGNTGELSVLRILSPSL